MQNEKLKQIRQAKEQEYGPFGSNMERIGKTWTALLGLDYDIPGYMVANMYVAAKLIRTGANFKQDTYDDAANYLYQAERMQSLNQAEADYHEEEKRKKVIAIAKRQDEYRAAMERLHQDNLKAQRKLKDEQQ